MPGRSNLASWLTAALAVVLLVTAALSFGRLDTQSSPGQSQVSSQPPVKRDIYVFLVQFLDRTNTTSASEIATRLDEVNAYFREVSYGAWTFNWVLFYPGPGESWYTVNETYAQATANPDLTPLARVITEANNSGITFPPPHTFPLVPGALIIHAGDDGAMTGNSTDIWSLTTGPYCSGLLTNPPNAYCLLTAIVAETDPVGIIAHELTHELQRFDEFGNSMGMILGHSTGSLRPGMVPVDWWDIMYQGLRNPVSNASIPKGEYPAECMAWNRMSLGFLPLSRIAVVDKGQSRSVTLHDLEEPASGIQAIRIPLGNTTLYHWYYFVELRKGISYDCYFPWLTTIYPDRMGMLVYWVNVSKYGEPFQISLMKAHGGDATAQHALFGPCSSPCVSAMSMYDLANDVSISITSTSDSAFVVEVNNAATPQSTPVCPSVSCFLGFLDLGNWGLCLNAVLAFGASIGVAMIGMRRRRGKQPHGVGGPTPRGKPPDRSRGDS